MFRTASRYYTLSQESGAPKGVFNALLLLELNRLSPDWVMRWHVNSSDALKRTRLLMREGEEDVARDMADIGHKTMTLCNLYGGENVVGLDGYWGRLWDGLDGYNISTESRDIIDRHTEYVSYIELSYVGLAWRIVLSSGECVTQGRNSSMAREYREYDSVVLTGVDRAVYLSDLTDKLGIDVDRGRGVRKVVWRCVSVRMEWLDVVLGEQRGVFRGIQNRHKVGDLKRRIVAYGRVDDWGEWGNRASLRISSTDLPKRQREAIAYQDKWVELLLRELAMCSQLLREGSIRGGRGIVCAVQRLLFEGTSVEHERATIQSSLE
ncbi:hypothetical protein Tco_0089687 [Tanacetum coccineum]